MSNEDYQIDFWGGCPICRKHDGYLNVGRANFFVCDEHKKRWLRGIGLFSTYQFESQEDWDKNWERIKDYEEVVPVYGDVEKSG